MRHLGHRNSASNVPFLIYLVLCQGSESRFVSSRVGRGTVPNFGIFSLPKGRYVTAALETLQILGGRFDGSIRISFQDHCEHSPFDGDSVPHDPDDNQDEENVDEDDDDDRAEDEPEDSDFEECDDGNADDYHAENYFDTGEGDDEDGFAFGAGGGEDGGEYF
ncbi:uncharacterized protein Z518_03237 [Rhinocladiella mackenziei CBS 650.93]|uniref:Uncharacterized protein n=1 Tax=Rhinocladiella mackenziei CBS 650.93 TaxID=1442369 RepID=A0A0D2IYX6_9EURO|nr:uncharacterized protein Z518_03237 [Rhinocladiella mackenziei CBS 650.93]KIX08581.1 hypothetical protein Z518_03237 [Rhinocladiella mackenziei CBS 650.93]